ncbi:hypothetical protein [Phenylobacterium sp.]|uniref:hypothetical protein n=1 Tax=Phenylobacterium sp. TaxID=1871053 RepID=UPI0035641011
MLSEALDQETGVPGFAAQLSASHPTLFSNVPVFVPSETLAEMVRFMTAVEAAAQLPGYREAAMAYAPPAASRDFGPVGALMGYDFHVTPEGPRLIEVNTNAGGAFLNAALARAQRACCGDTLGTETEAADGFAAKVAAMFREEWRRQRTTPGPTRIAIVDDAPEQQHLYPEFQLAKGLLEEHGLETVIADPEELEPDGSGVSVRGRPVDMVYNRLVDFALDEPRHAVLLAAYLGGGVVVTPNPHVHALFADKRNMALLSDIAALKAWGLSPGDSEALERGVLKTVQVTAANAEELWRRRRSLFFKPARGHGSKAAYRGDKLTHRVWAEISTGDYVAQAYAAPSTRDIAVGAERSELKVDIRLYTYAGSPLLAAARLYQGQTTNMRTPGGGFAPVLGV